MGVGVTINDAGRFKVNRSALAAVIARLGLREWSIVITVKRVAQSQGWANWNEKRARIIAGGTQVDGVPIPARTPAAEAVDISLGLAHELVHVSGRVDDSDEGEREVAGIVRRIRGEARGLVNYVPQEEDKMRTDSDAGRLTAAWEAVKAYVLAKLQEIEPYMGRMQRAVANTRLCLHTPLIEAEHARSGRVYAAVDLAEPLRPELHLHRELEGLPDRALYGILVHEAGHIVAMADDGDVSEDGADNAALELIGIPIWYDDYDIPGAVNIETVAAWDVARITRV